MAAVIPHTVATSKVELRFQCKKLKDLDVLSKSDPMIVVYHQDPRTQAWEKIGTTELIKNNLNPIFKTAIKIDYFFEEIQNLRFTVLDVDGDDLNKISEHDLIGEVTNCTLSKILSQSGQTLEVDVLDKHKKFAGRLRVTAEELKSTNQSFRFRLGGEKLDKKDFFGKSDPYYIISRRGANGAFLQVFQSEVIKNTLDPIFNEVSLKMEDICGSDLNANIKFDFYDWDSIGKHDFIGSFEASVNQLNTKGLAFNLINEKKLAKKGSSYKNSGVIKFFDSEIIREYNFLEYISGGCEISLVVGIDCTGSNGEPSTPTSLHYQHPTQPNQYANAIVSIGNVLAPYDSDGLYPVFGFGGVTPGKSQVSHCFPMSLTQDIYARGVEGILDVYYRNIKSVSLSGPTYFAPIIRNTIQNFASKPQSQTDQKYTILLIITDGEILDMDNTIDAIVEASSFPLSIVIVGVGNASFDNMNILDGDGALLQGSRGRAERDIVQFVPFRQFANLPFGALAAETLREIPIQFLQFMKKYRFKPNPPRPMQPQPSVMPIQGQPIQGQPIQGQPIQGQPIQGQPIQGQPTQGGVSLEKRN